MHTVTVWVTVKTGSVLKTSLVVVVRRVRTSAPRTSVESPTTLVETAVRVTVTERWTVRYIVVDVRNVLNVVMTAVTVVTLGTVSVWVT